MPLQTARRPSGDLAPAERLARAIRNIDKRLEQQRAGNQPISLSAHRARRILQDALARCREPGIEAHGKMPDRRTGTLAAPFSAESEPLEFWGCSRPPRTADLRSREWDRGMHAYEGKRMAYDWTGEATRKRNRLKLASAVLLSLAIIVGIPAALVPFL